MRTICLWICSVPLMAQFGGITPHGPGSTRFAILNSSDCKQATGVQGGSYYTLIGDLQTQLDRDFAPA